MQVNPYLSFDGCCAEAFRFYQSTMGGTDLVLMPFRGSPMEQDMPAEWLDKVLHGQMRIGTTTLMGSDAPPPRYRRPQGSMVSLMLSDVEESERIFAALSEGGSVGMPIMQTFWAKRFGMVTDRFGTPWMINCEASDPQ